MRIAISIIITVIVIVVLIIICSKITHDLSPLIWGLRLSGFWNTDRLLPSFPSILIPNVFGPQSSHRAMTANYHVQIYSRVPVYISYIKGLLVCWCDHYFIAVLLKSDALNDWVELPRPTFCWSVEFEPLGSNPGWVKPLT